MPATWNFLTNLDQHWVTDSTRIRAELGYTEIVAFDEALRQTIAWEREHPPVSTSPSHSKLLNYSDEDEILERLRS